MPGKNKSSSGRKRLSEKTMKRMVRLAERDGYECGECLMPINDINQANIDHVLPLSSGGNGRMCNLQVTHIACNSIKGDRFTSNSRLKVEKLRLHYGEEFCNTKSKNKRQTSALVEVKKTHEVNDRTQSGLKVKRKKNGRKVTSVRKEPPQPAELWNEIVKHGLSRLSFEKFKGYFEEYRRYDTIEVTIESQG